ncbi:RNA polymerase sigma factor RpoH [Candidatus Persebacteraceae bacterium Df01]|uniref:RNA polymerase sigma factor RpoH n=1 Tax=Candidatus Doriopsillibacter californiensis TaxID=2970740 RepID=A0ABT7QL80_9GAMM|nr:RNA polymerase sigma factor RpoH [Candidatus Persebacteraceae bacterium Df01]
MNIVINPSLPSVVGNLDAYIRSVNSIPMLSEQEEHRLAIAYREHNDIQAARQLALAHLRLVIATAHSYAGYGLEQSDLIQEGNIGLLKAVKKYDPLRGARLSTFALYWIRAEIHNFILRNWRIVKIATTKAHRKLFFNMRNLFKKNKDGYLQDAAETARELGVTAKDISEMRSRLHNTNVVSMNADENSSGTEFTLEAQADKADPERLLIEQKDGETNKENVTLALAALDDRSRTIVESRHLREKATTLHTLAAQFNISAERVRQLEAQALQKMRHFFQTT